MTVTENDIELLEAYLDGALPDEQRAALELRLRQDRALSELLDELRSARMTRTAVWRSLEPDEAQIERLVSRIGAGARRDEIWRWRAGALKWVSAAAASVLLGVGLGWFGRTAMAPQAPVAPIPVATVPADDSGFRVALTDEAGNVVAVQKFDSMERAREFTTDLQQWQQRQRQVQDGNLILVGDRF